MARIEENNFPERKLFLCGDVMTGRGVDQVLPHPGDPTLHEPSVRDARRYVELAEEAHGSVTRPLDPPAIWGDALTTLDAVQPAARIVNLETAVTRADGWWPDKEVHYRMHPANVGCLTAARIDVASLVRLSRHPATEPFWSAGVYRFDDPDPDGADAFGTCYTASTIEVAFAESVIHECGGSSAAATRCRSPN